MDGMSDDAVNDTDPTSRASAADPDALSTVAALVREATRLANDATGTDLRSPWLDVVAEAVTASGYLADVPDPPTTGAPDGDLALPAGTRALIALERAATALDAAGGRRDHRATAVRAALSDAIATARRIRS